MGKNMISSMYFFKNGEDRIDRINNFWIAKKGIGKATMNNLCCNICESDVLDSFLNKNSWEIMRCQICGLVFVKNIPSEEDLKKEYDEKFFHDGQKSPLKGSNINNNPSYLNARRRLKRHVVSLWNLID